MPARKRWVRERNFLLAYLSDALPPHCSAFCVTGIFSAVHRCFLTRASKTIKNIYVKQFDKHQRKNIVKCFCQADYLFSVWSYAENRRRLILCRVSELSTLFSMSYESWVCLWSRLTKYEIYSCTTLPIKQDRNVIFISSRSTHKCFLKLICFVLHTFCGLVDFPGWKGKEVFDNVVWLWGASSHGLWKQQTRNVSGTASSSDWSLY